MSSIYKVGSSVVCPAASLNGDKAGVTGSIESFRNHIPYIKWEDGVTGYVKQKHLITKDKYEEFLQAGLDDKTIAEYIALYNGNIYN